MAGYLQMKKTGELKELLEHRMNNAYLEAWMSGITIGFGVKGKGPMAAYPEKDIS